MDKKVVSRLFASTVLVAIVASAPATGDQSAALSPDPLKANPAADLQAPIVLAQGRCFNGRCY